MTAPMPLETVEVQMTSLRRLAHQLLGHSHEAEDALQETWLRAVQSAPRHLDRPREWLETVLRNVVRQRYRQIGRERRRDRRAAVPEASSPSAAEAVIRQQSLRALTEAILTLPPELQDCVFLRYFEDLPPRQIAARLDQPVFTIYRRLERAKRRLRQRLEARQPNWRQGMAVLVGCRPVASALALGGALIVTKKILAGIAAFALLLILVYTGGPWSMDEPLAPTETDPSTLTAERPTVAPTETGPATEAERTAIAAGAAEAERALAPYEFDFQITARTVDDLPAAHTPIFLAPENHPLNATSTGDDGVARIRWRGRTPTMTVVFHSTRDATHGDRLRRMVVHAGVVSQAAIRVQAIPARGSGNFLVVEGTTFELFATGSKRQRKRNSHRRTLPLHRDPEGWSSFTRGQFDDEASIGLEIAAIQSALVQVENRFKLLTVESTLQPLALADKDEIRTLTVTGTVRGPTGQPVAGAQVRIADRWQTRTDATGKYGLKIQARNRDHLSARAGGGDHGLATTHFDVGEPDRITWDPRLDRGKELTGHLWTPEGQALSGWQIEIEPEDGSPWVDGTTTGADGSFAIPNVESRSYRLRAYPPKAAFAILTAAGLAPDTDHNFTVIQPRGLGSIQVAARDLAGENVRGTEARLWNDRTGDGRWLRTLEKKVSIVAGSYRLVLGGPGYDLLQRGLVRIDPGRNTDYGAVDLGEPTILDLRGAKPELGLYHLHPTVPSRIQIEGGKRMRVPAGEYLGILAGEEHRFTLGPGLQELPLGK